MIYLTENYPYVYKLIHKETGQFYIGFRCANKVLPKKDLGIFYFSSSATIKKMGFENFNYEILCEFNDHDRDLAKNKAFNYEQQLIYECRNNPLILNKHYVVHRENDGSTTVSLRWNPSKKQTTKQVKCPKCGKTGEKRLMLRWHFDNCGKIHAPSWKKGKHGFPQKKVTCPYCGITGGVGSMKPYHFENCKKERRTPWNKGKRGGSNSNKNKKWDIVMCPHCGKQGGGNDMKRWHFDRCKNKKSVI